MTVTRSLAFISNVVVTAIHCMTLNLCHFDFLTFINNIQFFDTQHDSKQMVKVIWHKSRIAHGRFNGIRQVDQYAPHLLHTSLGLRESSTHLDQFSCFCWADYSDRLTDHATRSVTTDHIYVCSTAMQPKNCKQHQAVCSIQSKTEGSTLRCQTENEQKENLS